MSWHDLLFLHWPVAVEDLRPHIPTQLEIDTFEGTAWIAVVPFRMSGVGPRFVPAVPGVSAFPELNLRTYVRTGGKAGVWFFSLDVTSRLAVQVARTVFHLPYFRATMEVREEGDGIGYASARRDGGKPFGFAGKYRGDGRVFRADPDSLESWLTERYCLYAANRRGKLFRGEIHHDPWPLENATCEIFENSLPAEVGLTLPSRPPLAHFARRLDVVAWTLESVHEA